MLSSKTLLEAGVCIPSLLDPTSLPSDRLCDYTFTSVCNVGKLTGKNVILFSERDGQLSFHMEDDKKLTFEEKLLTPQNRLTQHDKQVEEVTLSQTPGNI